MKNKENRKKRHLIILLAIFFLIAIMFTIPLSIIMCDCSGNQDNPTYVVPTGLTVVFDSERRFSDIELPNGWRWVNPSELVGNVGTREKYADFFYQDTFIARYRLSVLVTHAFVNPPLIDGVIGLYGQALSNVVMPNRWTWNAPNTSLSPLGQNSFEASFQPVNPNYRAIIDLDVTIIRSFEYISAGDFHNIALCYHGNVWTWGAGSDRLRSNSRDAHGWLGHGSYNNELRPRRIDGISGFTNIYAVAAGSEGSMALDSNGNLWSWGSGSYNLGLGYSNLVDITRPQMIETGYNDIQLPKFVAISLDRISMALDIDGNLWSWGFTEGLSGSNVLGHGDIRNISRPKKITYGYNNMLLPEFISINTANTHSMAIDASGNIWTWGFGGGLGHVSAAVRPQILELCYNNEALPSFIEISAGFSHSMAIDEYGYVWSWGSDNGRLGHGLDSSVFITRPKKIAGLNNIATISASAGFHIHNMALCKEGYVWTFGHGRHGQLGHGTDSNEYTPRKIEGLSNIRVISASNDVRSVVVCEIGHIWTFGSGNWLSGLWGTLHNNFSNMPIRVV
ncbi:MAG: hypothetical protein FWD82_00045 [Defluviitaleaceae bacterium]|nr:hypothetical protein [Defluviitaleaceae bacterium]